LDVLDGGLGISTVNCDFGPKRRNKNFQLYFFTSVFGYQIPRSVLDLYPDPDTLEMLEERIKTHRRQSTNEISDRLKKIPAKNLRQIVAVHEFVSVFF
jgi:hypothetical protein